VKTAQECRHLSQTCRIHVCNILSDIMGKEKNDERLKLIVDGIVQAAVLETAALMADSQGQPPSTTNLPRRKN